MMKDDDNNNNNKNNNDDLAFALGSFAIIGLASLIIPLIDALSPLVLLNVRLINTKTKESYPLNIPATSSPLLSPLSLPPSLPPPPSSLSIPESELQYYNLEFEITGVKAEPQALFIKHTRPDGSSSGWLQIDIAREKVSYSASKGGYVTTVTVRLQDLLAL